MEKKTILYLTRTHDFLRNHSATDISTLLHTNVRQFIHNTQYIEAVNCSVKLYTLETQYCQEQVAPWG